MMQGAVGASGPIIGSWLYAYRLPSDAYILSLSVLFLITGVAQITTLASIGAYDSDRLIAAAVGFGPVLAVLPVGEHLRARLSGSKFDQQTPSGRERCVSVRHRASGCSSAVVTTTTPPPEAHPIAELPTSMSSTPSGRSRPAERDPFS